MDEVGRSAYLRRNITFPAQENQKLKFHYAQEKSIITEQEWTKHRTKERTESYLQNLFTNMKLKKVFILFRT